MALLSIREYAKRRGVSHTAVRKAIESQRLAKAVKRTEGGVVIVDSDLADAEWPKGVREILQDSYKEGAKLNAKSAPAPGPTTVSDMPGVQVDKVASTYAQSRAVKEAYNAKLAQHTFNERSGKVVDAEEVKAEAFKVARLTRDAIMNVPDRIAAQLAAETDTFKVSAMLAEELRKALEGLKLE